MLIHLTIFLTTYHVKGTEPSIVGWLILNSYPERICVLLRGIRHVPLINSPARWRRWPGKSAKGGPSGCTGEHQGSMQFGWCLSMDGEWQGMKSKVGGLWDTFFALLLSSFLAPGSIGSLTILTCVLLPSLCAKQTFLQMKISYLLEVKHKEDRRASSQNSQGDGYTGEFSGQCAVVRLRQPGKLSKIRQAFCLFLTVYL